MSRKQFAEAVLVLRRAIRSGDDHLEALYGTLSSVHSIRGRPDEQVSVLEEGIAALPDDAGLKIQLANALLTQGTDFQRIRALLAEVDLGDCSPWQELAQDILTKIGNE